MIKLDTLKETLTVLYERRKKRILMGAMLSVIALNALFFLIPLLQKAYELNLNVSQLKSEILNARHEESQIDRMDQTFMWSKTRLVLDEYLLAQGDISKYLDSLSELAKKTHVRIISVEPVQNPALQARTEKKGVPYEIVEFRLTASAGYHPLGKFVALLENHQIFIRIAELKIEANGQTPAEHTLNMRIQMLHKKDAA